MKEIFLENNNSEFLHTINLISAKLYGVDYLLKSIATIVYPCDHRPFIVEPSFSPKWDIASVDIEAEERIAVAPKSDSTCCECCKENKKKYRHYLGDRLRDAVVDKKFEIWSSFSFLRVSAPPIDGDVYSWAMLGSIFKSDLIMFCNEQKIGVKFEGEEENNNETDTQQLSEGTVGNEPDEHISKELIATISTSPHGNIKVNEERRKNVIGAAIECRKSFPDTCKTGTDWAKTLDQKSALYWPDKDDPPLAISTIEDLLRGILKKEKAEIDLRRC